MSTYRQARKDDSSDDEGPTKRVKRDEDEEEDRNYGVSAPVDKKVSSRNVWADVVHEEELTIKGTVMDMDDYRKNSGSAFVKIRRGAETYTVPAQQLEENAAALEAGKNMEEEAPPPTFASDDPFGDTADLGEVEAFGVGPSSGRVNSGRGGGGNWQSRGMRGGRGGGGVRGGWMSKSRGGGGHHPHHVPTTEDGEAMELGEGGAGFDVSSGNRGRGGWRGGAHAPRGFIPRGRGNQGNWRGGDRKRTWNNDYAKDPKELMDGGYSLAGLMATEFQEGLTPLELGEQIAKALGERVADTVVKIVEAIGEKKALELLEETKKAEQAGGVKVADGSRRRTPGGVYIMLFKADVDVEPAIKEKIFEVSRDQQRKTLKAKRNRNKNPQDVSKNLDELQQLLNEKKKELEGAVKKEEMEEGEATPSPAVDGEEELDYGEEEETPSPEME